MTNHVVSHLHAKCGICKAEFQGVDNPRVASENAYVQFMQHFAKAHKGQGHTCGRRAENGMDKDDSVFVGAGSGIDFYNQRDGKTVCSYCGSLQSTEFTQRVSKGEKLIPTDKSYKVYVGPDHSKFYFQHLTEQEMRWFIDELNAQRVQFDVPGYFYVKPFFIR